MGPTPTSTNQSCKDCSEVVSSNCVFWDYDDVPCLGICKGMKMTDAMYKEAVLTCQLLAQITGDIATAGSGPPPIDFSGLNFGCAWSPTVTKYVCPGTQVYVPVGTGTPPGYCGILGPAGSGIFYPGIGWIIAASSAIPTLTTIPNPIPAPSTLIDVLQLIIDSVPCCDPCN